MRSKLILGLLPILLCMQSAFSNEKPNPGSKIVIVIEAPLPEFYKSDVLTLRVNFFSPKRFIHPRKSESIKKQIRNGQVKWEIITDDPAYIFNELFANSMAYIAEVGDSIHIRYANGKPVFTGKGAEKLRIRKMLTSYYDTLSYSRPEELSHPDSPCSSLQDYLAWNKFLNQKSKDWLDWLEKNRMNLSEFGHMEYKLGLLKEIEKLRMHKFHSIRRSTVVGPRNQYGLSNEDLCHIYDTTMDNASSRWLRFGIDFIYDPDYAWDMIHDEDYRRRGKFFQTSESDTALFGRDPADPYLSIYNRIKELYKGVVRENFLAFTFCSGRGVLKNVGFSPKVEAMLSDYYAQPGYFESKKNVKEYESSYRNKWYLTHAPEFTLTEATGKQFNSQQLRGKVVVLDFWFTGCTGCVQMADALRKVERKFTGDSNIVFLSVSVDKDKEQWLKSIALKKYTTGEGVQLYTEGQGNGHDIIKKLVVQGYPTLEIIDPNGMLVKYNKKKTDPRKNDGQEMIELLQKQLSFIKDGPYIFYDSTSVMAYSIDGNKVSKRQLANPVGAELQVQTDQQTSFNVLLQPLSHSEPSEFPEPEKIFALSDIEGNLDAFRKLLQNNKIIDENFNWIFGNGHLVFAGDMFDRGKQVTECLWLIYSLEEKAKKAGGYVHFILGNHEIMNMQGNHDYVEEKYKDNAALMGKTLSQLYNENSELGLWLRRKNIVEKIGDTLFLHGGISRKINQLPLTITEINQLARPYYAVSRNDYGDEVINSIMGSSTSPFWYRSYYGGYKEMSQVVDSTLQKFSVSCIVTGHTIVADTISVHYDGKVINLDTKHAEGKSEALIKEGNRFYRVNALGKKYFLFSGSCKNPLSFEQNVRPSLNP